MVDVVWMKRWRQGSCGKWTSKKGEHCNAPLSTAAAHHRAAARRRKGADFSANERTNLLMQP